ncbi:MAG: CinA family protein [Pelagibacteraceae bacterium]|jgi:nicotinamide-nucleotide amidase|tara:strand:- start:73 stop:540 length:468 start_codon:yes stop_codon:yes gene_type:complete
MKNTLIIKKLIKKNISISVAESCTGGLLSAQITSVPNSSKVFNLGIVCYSNQSKKNILKIKNKNLNKYGAVSLQICKQMLENLYKLSKSNLCVTTTGIAGPGGGTKIKPVGLVFVGIKYKKKTQIHMFNFKKNFTRKKIQNSTVNKIFKLISLII